jgi:hypothetical protein
VVVNLLSVIRLLPVLGGSIGLYHHCFHLQPTKKARIKPIILARLNATDEGILYLNENSAWALIPSKAALSE